MVKIKTYTNGKIQGTIVDIEKLIFVLSEIALNEGHTRLYIQGMKESIYDQFSIPANERRVLRIV